MCSRQKYYQEHKKLFFSKEEDGYCAQVVRKEELGPHVEFQSGARILASKLEASINFQKEILEKKVRVFILQNEYKPFEKVEFHFRKLNITDTSPLFVGFLILCYNMILMEFIEEGLVEMLPMEEIWFSHPKPFNT